MGRERTRPEIHSISVDDMCDMVNEKYNLKRHGLGSIEHYSDMCANAIVQICNPYRGTKTLITGDNKTLKTFLCNILDGKTELNVKNIQY